MLTSAITVNQIELLHHTLGVNLERRQPYRNHFVAGRGHHDLPDLEALEAAGLMIRGTAPGFLPDTDTVFHVTDAGRAYALESLPPAPPPPKRSKYLDYLDICECYDSFGEFLGIQATHYEEREEYRGDWPNYKRVREYRMYRGNRWSSYGSDVKGDWASTKKEAKASYKAALKARRAATLKTNRHNKEHA